MGVGARARGTKFWPRGCRGQGDRGRVVSDRVLEHCDGLGSGSRNG